MMNKEPVQNNFANYPEDRAAQGCAAPRNAFCAGSQEQFRLKDSLRSYSARVPKIKMAYLVSHPIQYQVPLIKKIASREDVDLTVFYCSNLSIAGYVDDGFGVKVNWDVPLLDGYQYVFLPSIGGNKKLSFFKPFNYGLCKRLRRGHFDVLWIHGYARWVNWIAIVYAKLLGIKVFIRDEATFKSASRGKVKRFLKKCFFKVLDHFVSAYLAIGTENKHYYLMNGISEKKIFQAPYTVDNDFFITLSDNARNNRQSFRQSLGLQPDRQIILFASKITKRKCPDILLRAYQKLIEALPVEQRPYLLFVGDGELRHQLEEEVLRKKMSTVKFLGFQNQTQMPKYYDLADIFVLPSYHEPWGLVINEAMCAGCAIVACDEVGAANDLIRTGVNGELCKREDVNSLSDALLKVLKNYPKMKEASRIHITAWGFDQTIKGLLQACYAVWKVN